MTGTALDALTIQPDRTKAPVMAHIPRDSSGDVALCGRRLDGEYVADPPEVCVVCRDLAGEET
jgi:hypothetical protein